MKPRTDRPKKTQTQRALITGTIATLAITTSLVYAGMRIERASHHTPLPANEACYKATTDQKLHLQASVNAQFGTPIPEGTPTAEQVNKLIKECGASREITTVKVEATK